MGLLPKLSAASNLAVMAAEQRARYDCMIAFHKIFESALAPLMHGESEALELSAVQLYSPILDFAAARFDAEAKALLQFYAPNGDYGAFDSALAIAFFVMIEGLLPHLSAAHARELDEEYARMTPDEARRQSGNWESMDQLEKEIQESRKRLAGGVDYEREARDNLRDSAPHCPSSSASELLEWAVHCFNHELYEQVCDGLIALSEPLRLDPDGSLYNALRRLMLLRVDFWHAESMAHCAGMAALDASDSQGEDSPVTGPGARELLKEFRKRTGLSNQWIAKNAGFSVRALYDISSGKTKKPTDKVKGELEKVLSKGLEREIQL